MPEEIPPPPAEAIEVLEQSARRNRAQTVLLIAAGLGMALGLIGFAVALGSRDDAVEQAQKTTAEVEVAKVQAAGAVTQAKKAADAVEEANRRLRAAGKPTVPVPTVSTAAPLPEELATEAEVRRMITTEVSRLKLSLSPVELDQIARTAASLIPTPRDGKTPTAGQVRAVVVSTVAAYCAGDRCKGAKGDTGTTGTTGTAGEDGARGEQGGRGDTGPPGPGPTDEQLLAAAASAVRAYCADRDSCRGPAGPVGPQGPPGAESTVPGPQGQQGPPGAEGKGVRDMDCQGTGNDSSWVITYTDGTTSTATGPCRLAALPAIAAKKGN